MPRKRKLPPSLQNDIAYQETEKLIEQMEKKIRKEYMLAMEQTEAKLKKYLEAYDRKNEQKLKDVAAGRMTKAEYTQWRKGQIMIGKRWQEMADTLTEDYMHTREIAESIVKGYMPEVYALNHNYATFMVEKESLIDTSYTLYNAQAVENLMRTKNILPAPSYLTQQKLREGKLKRWNKQKINSAVTQGILQGENSYKVAKRLRQVTTMDMNASIRNARTAITYAQNKGRLDAFKRAEGMGINQGKQWIACMDGKTRHWHVQLDGEVVPLDEPFVNDYGEIDFPGDNGADPANVYNCRCAMKSVLMGFDFTKHSNDWFKDRKNDELGDMTYDEWKQQHLDWLKAHPRKKKS